MKKIIVTPDAHTQLIAQDDALGKMSREIGPDLIESDYQVFVANSVPVMLVGDCPAFAPTCHPIDIPMLYMESLRNKVGVRTVPKIKRNEPCQCGSGVKAKKCKCVKDQAAV
jgi:hypothetical protein